MYGQPYYDPGIQQMYNERMMQLQQQYPQYFNQQYPQQQQGAQSQPNTQMQSQQPSQVTTQRQADYLPGRAVTSVDEVRALSADPMGAIGVYTDVGNKKIYTKQINTDGLAVLNTYLLDETPPPAPPEPKEYAEKAEVAGLFDQIGLLTREIETLKGELSNATTTASSNQNSKGSAKPDANVSATNAKQPATSTDEAVSGPSK